ncbi:hypothetical protein M8J77_023273 [Diaphorina citri]|nr:hypothetical protein M8J77_023273 [Diaphorina citri]
MKQHQTLVVHSTSSSSSSRSRSATPDSLDYLPPSPPLSWSPPTPVDTPTQIKRLESRREVRRLPSAPVLPHRDIFRRGVRHEGDIVASETAEGVRMLGYHRLGSVRYRGGWGTNGTGGGGGGGTDRMRSGSDPLNLSSSVPETKEQPNSLCVPRAPVTRSHGSLFELDSVAPSQDSLGLSGSHQSLGLSASHQSLVRTGSECLGFEDMWSDQADTSLAYQPESLSEEVNVGRTWVDSLGEEDLSKLRPLLFLELTALFDSCNLRFHKRKPHKRKRREDGSIFGASLSSLVERDSTIVAEPRPLPLVFQKLFDQLERRGLKEEGILRVAAHKTKVDRLCADLEREFYTRHELVDQILSSCHVHDLTAILKRLLRDLPEPLLSAELTHLFYETHLLPDCTRALNLLVLLLPAENRALLIALLSFLARLVAQQGTNKMSAHNVAMIIAPSLFPPRYVRSNKGDLKAEISMAAISCRLTETLMMCNENLWVVPCELVAQLRLSNEQSRYYKENHKPMKKLWARGCREPVVSISRKIHNEVDYQDGVIRVSARQFHVDMFPLGIDETTTAGDVILRIVEEANLRDSELRSQRKLGGGGGRRDMKVRGALTDLAPNGNLSCLLTTADPDLALQTHFLYEMGGNIGQRRIEPSAMMLAVYQDNPNASWEVKCDHRNGIKQYQNDR